ncbi:hypothetical protein RDABS01_026833 [Bienertia sinuspersici]
MEGEKIIFDSKPVLLKAWSQESDMDLDNIMTVPIWIHVHAHYKYWSQQSLEKLTRGIGKFVKVEHTTVNRDRLAYARFMVEVKMDQHFPHQVCFLDEHNQKQSIPITYEWRPVKCNVCHLIGHDVGQCYRKNVTNTKVVWQQKRVKPEKQVDARKAETRKNDWVVVTSKNKKNPADNIPYNQENPGNADLAKIEHESALDYNKKNKCFSQFLKQKAKIR